MFFTKEAPTKSDERLSLMDKHEGEVEAAILASIAITDAALTDKDLESLAENATMAEIANQIEATTAAANGNDAVMNSWVAAFLASGILTANEVKDEFPNIQYRFDPFEQNVARLASEQQVAALKALNDSQRNALMNALRNSLVSGATPAETARRIRQSIGLNARFEQALANYEKALRNLDRTALNRLLRDKRFDPTVAAAIRDGKALSEAQIVKMVTAYRKRLIAHRAKVIARDFSLNAMNMAQEEAWSQMSRYELLGPEARKQWVYTKDDRTRHAHYTIPSLNPGGVPIGQSYISELGPIMRPHDPNAARANVIHCRCYQRLVMT